jgi:putative AlgH/UPF0301 family transcriptional regulator
MQRLCQHDRTRAMGMIQDEMTHQVVADHFNVSRQTRSRIMIRLRQTVRMKDPVTAGRV